MSNPFNTINPQNPYNVNNMAGIRNLYQSFRNSGNNPMQLLQNMAMSNPQLQPVFNMLRNGANPQQVFMNICQQRGINAQEFIRNLTGNSTF